MPTGIGKGVSPFLRTVNSSGIDPTVQSFLNATGITNQTEIDAITFITKSCKGTNLSYNPTGVNLFIDMPVIYLFTGGTATTMKFNLKDARDLDAAYRVTWSGGITFSSTGALGNGVNSSGDTHYNPSVHGNLTNYSFARYYRNSVAAAGFMGCFESSLGVYEFMSSGVSQDMGIGDYPAAICSPGSPQTKFVIARRDAPNSSEILRNGASVATSAGVATALPNTNFNLFALDEGGGTLNANRSGNELAFFAICNFGSVAKANLLRNIVDQYQVMLSRNV